MKTLKPVLGPAFLSLVVAGGAAAGSWTPDPNFRIEDGNYKETLIFIWVRLFWDDGCSRLCGLLIRDAVPIWIITFSFLLTMELHVVLQVTTGMQGT